MFVCLKLTHCGVQISIRRISVYFVLDCPANEGLVGRIGEGGLRSPEESGVALDRQREMCGKFR